ncbi:MAG: AraC family transcriptional regulator [Hydrogenophaga sp.]|nr:AraC family transcriptional regulator [Hydrogenophaga sp.]
MICSTPLLIRAASLSGFAELAQACGLNAADVLQRYGLTLAMLADADQRVPLAAVMGVLEDASHLADRDDFGLRLAARRQISNLGAAGMLMLLQPTLRDAWHGLIERRQVLNDGLLIRLEEANGVAVLSFDLVREPGGPAVRQSVELVMCVQVRLMRLFLGADWMPRRVLFRHPPPMDAALHAQLLGPCVEFGSGFNGLVLPSRDLDQPLASADPALAERVKHHLLPRAHEGSLADQVRQLLFLMLPRGKATVDQVAAHLGMQRRTLQRRLDAEGVPFKPLLHALRLELAQGYVLQSDRSLADVALLLGFSSPSAFSRWYVAQFGLTADAARRCERNRPRAAMA